MSTNATIRERLNDATQTSSDEREKARALEQFAEPRRNTRQATDDTRRHTDADSLRRYFGIKQWDRSAFNFATVIPNYLDRAWDPPTDETVGGTDVLATGKPGSGKSTLACYLATRDIEVNYSKVVWRGSSSRSEWLPLAPWTRLCLPAGVPIRARLESKDPTKPAVGLDVADLERIVREVVRYRDPMELNQELLQPGQIHVVYPDPKMRGCQAIYEESAEKSYDAPQGRKLFDEADPAGHWWFAWVLARVEHGPHDWTTCDEIGDIAPQSAQKDAFATYQKVELLKDTWVDARKFGLTINAFGHGEVDIHQMVRHKMRWRIQLASDSTESGTSGGGGGYSGAGVTAPIATSSGLLESVPVVIGAAVLVVGAVALVLRRFLSDQLLVLGGTAAAGIVALVLVGESYRPGIVLGPVGRGLGRMVPVASLVAIGLGSWWFYRRYIRGQTTIIQLPNGKRLR